MAFLTTLSAAASPGPPLIAEWSLLDPPDISSRELANATRWPMPPPPAVPDPAPASREPLPTVLIVPNADGLIDTVTLSVPGTDEQLPNPFQARWHAPTATRETLLVVESVLQRDRPEYACVCLNGRVLSPGESVEGFTIMAISSEGLALRRGRLLVRCPIGERPLRLRLAEP